jgi:predicted TIM-barrel fold metal-dependent hydrolase
MFGSDWSSIFRHVSDPLDYYNLMIKIVKEAPITQQEKEAILFDNAARLFRVKPH